MYKRQYQDIGIFLRDKICEYFEGEKIPISLKYIDPSYLIRSVPANTADRILSDQMARYAVHSAMAGNTDVLIGLWNNVFVHVPICTAIRAKRRMDAVPFWIDAIPLLAVVLGFGLERRARTRCRPLLVAFAIAFACSTGVQVGRRGPVLPEHLARHFDQRRPPPRTRPPRA